MPEFLTSFSTLGVVGGDLISSLGQYGAPAIFFSVLFMGETAVLISLLLTQQGVLQLTDVLFFSTIATLSADMFWFLVGRYFPKNIIPVKIDNNIFKPTISFLEGITKNRIFLSILFLKFFIGTRLIFLLFLGRQPISLIRFFLYNVIGTLVYMMVLTIIGVGFGHLINDIFPAYRIVTSIIVGVLFVVLVSRIIKSFIKHRTH
jgi:membrane protein DedA with SNARE-associated domain